jgi:predicted RNase H-like HicB family nuclease
MRFFDSSRRLRWRFYPAVLERGSKATFASWFPDFPGCVAGGKSQEETVEKAENALAQAVEALAEEGRSLPEPTPIERIAQPSVGGLRHQPARNRPAHSAELAQPPAGRSLSCHGRRRLNLRCERASSCAAHEGGSTREDDDRAAIREDGAGQHRLCSRLGQAGGDQRESAHCRGRGFYHDRSEHLSLLRLRRARNRHPRAGAAGGVGKASSCRRRRISILHSPWATRRGKAVCQLGSLHLCDLRNAVRKP